MLWFCLVLLGLQLCESLWSEWLSPINKTLLKPCWWYPKGCGHMSPVMRWLLGHLSVPPAAAVLDNFSGVLRRVWW